MRFAERKGTPPARAQAEDPDLAALRSGDEAAFRRLVDAYSPALLSMARVYVPSAAVAEDVVQETWLGVISGLDRFEGRSSLKTWVCRILINTAKTRGKQERRTLPFSAAAQWASGEEEPLVGPERFLPSDHEVWPEHWAVGPTRWEMPEERLLAGETRDAILEAIDSLAPAQREVITMRDIHGWSSWEVCGALEISAGNQRVLLHRARTNVRLAVESRLGAVERVPDSPAELTASVHV